MFDKCFAEIEQKTGVKVSKTRAGELQEAFSNSFLAAARSMSEQDALREAARLTSEKILADAKGKKLSTLRNAAAQQAMLGYMSEHPEFTPAEAVRRRLTDMYDLKAGTVTVEQHARAIRSIELARIDQMFQAIGTKFGITLDKDAELIMLKALHGEQLPPELAEFSALAEKHIQAFDQLRARLEAAGVPIGQIPRYFAGQAWDNEMVSKAWKFHPKAKEATTPQQQRALAREQFIDDFANAADRSQYLDDAGLPMDDAQLRLYLGGAFDNIFLDSDNNLQRISGPQLLKAQLGRKLHIKDAESWQALTSRYSGENVLDAMIRTADRLSKAVALAETFGPNFERTIADTIAAAEGGFKQVATQKQQERNKTNAARLKRELDYFSRGEAQVDGWLRESAQVLRAAQRNVLGGAMITSLFGDLATRAFILKMNGVTGITKLMTSLRSMSREELQEQGLVAERFQSALVRDVGEIPEKGIISSLSTLNIRASLLPALNRARINAGREHLAEALAKKVGKYDFDQLDGIDGTILRSYGITAQDWADLKTVQGKYLSVKAIADSSLPDATKRRLSEKVQAYLTSEIDLFMEPGLRLQAVLRGTTTAGTFGGELFRSAMQFKTFTGVMMTQVYPRLLSVGDRVGLAGSALGGAAAIGFAYMVASTIAGLLIEEVKALVAGKNPLDATDPKVLMKAMVTGGGMPILGDLLFATESRVGGGVAELLAGPAVSTIGVAADTALRPLHQAMDDKELDIGADLFRQVRSLTPFTSLWYTRAAVDRGIMLHINEGLSPGYTSRQVQRADRDYGQSYWWAPDQPFPEDVPDLTEAIQ